MGKLPMENFLMISMGLWARRCMFLLKPIGPIPLLTLVLVLLTGCGSISDTPESAAVVHVVGEIFHDSEKDDDAFIPCGAQDRILQYYAFQEKTYQGEKYALHEKFFNKYKAVNTNTSGLLRIRFVVNCKGAAGRFRLLAMNKNYEKVALDTAITSQLLEITKSLQGWKPMMYQNQSFDYYQYLIFKIEKGRLIEIMP